MKRSLVWSFGHQFLEKIKVEKIVVRGKTRPSLTLSSLPSGFVRQSLILGNTLDTIHHDLVHQQELSESYCLDFQLSKLLDKSSSFLYMYPASGIIVIAEENSLIAIYVQLCVDHV